MLMGINQSYRPESEPLDASRISEEVKRLQMKAERLEEDDKTPPSNPFARTEEYERKFLVDPLFYTTIKSDAHSHTSRIQAYFELEDNHFVSEIRVAKRSDREYGTLTIKTARIGSHRTEFHFKVPAKEAIELMGLSPYRVAKNRYFVSVDGVEWEVDFFTNENAGLVIAEVEFADAESMVSFTNSHKLPHWVGKEVTDDPRYYNCNLAKRPWVVWPGVGGEKKEGVVSRWLRSRFH